jgi:Protein of unknown function (DUF2846)
MNKKMIGLGIAALALAPFAMAQDNAPAATPASDAAASAGGGTVVFFREKKFAGSAIRYKVRENGVELCKLASGTYCNVQVPAGKHVYVVHSEAKDVLNLEVEPGETYYVVGGISMGFMAGHPNLSPSTKDVFDGMKDKLKDNTGKDLGGPDDDAKKEDKK